MKMMILFDGDSIQFDDDDSSHFDDSDGGDSMAMTQVVSMTVFCNCSYCNCQIMRKVCVNVNVSKRMFGE